MNPATANLIAALIPALTQLGIQGVKGIVDLVHGNPQKQDETDAAYVARVGAQTDAILVDALKKDAQVEQD